MSDTEYTDHKVLADVEFGDRPGSKLERPDRLPVRGRLIVGDRSFLIRGEFTDIADMVENAVEAIADKEGIDLEKVSYVVESRG